MQSKALEVIQSILNGENYSDSKSNDWGHQICQNLLTQMQQLYNTQYKFVVDVLITSQSSDSFNDTQIALWDNQNDKKISTKWNNETIRCVLNLWAFKTKC